MTAMIGTDPELFLRDSRTGAVVPGVGLIGGTKKRPLPMKDMRDGFALQEDNVMLEFNVPPSGTAREFSRTVSRALEYAYDFIRIKQPHLELDRGHCARMFTMEQLDSMQARVFGCSADYNAHEEGRALPTPSPESLIEGDMAWRFSGGHVHLGYDIDVPPFVVGALADVFLGLPSVQLDRQGARRTLYGSAGRYRPTAHGLEYRTLSNYWIWEDSTRLTIGQQAFKLLSFLEEWDQARLQTVFAEVPWTDVISAINQEDSRKAMDLMAYLRGDLGVPL